MNIRASPAAFRAVLGLVAAAALAAVLVLSPMTAPPQVETAPTQAPAAAKGPLVIKEQSFFYIGGHYDETQPDRHVVGQMYVEYQIPAEVRHPFPIVMVHGGTATGTLWSATPDGREGWEQYFLRQGYPVYVVDQVARGRSPYEPTVYGKPRSQTTQYILERFTASERFKLWPQAHLHTQWPGKAEVGDPVYDNYAASNFASMEDRDAQTAMNVHALSALLDRIGPSIVFVHSQAGQYAWPLAQERPALVKAIVGVEPSGPPVHDLVVKGGEPRFGVTFDAATKQDEAEDQFRDSPELKRYGLGDHPLSYAPAISAGAPLEFVRQEKADGPDLARCWQQKEPAKRLVAVGDRPVLYVAAEASFYAPYHHCTVKYLEQASVKVDFVKLAEIGISGNGHLMMLEKNSDEIARVIANWLAKVLPNPSAAQR
jgi:pimeloyl-ACP methyl ester carboxylesterase